MSGRRRIECVIFALVYLLRRYFCRNWLLLFFCFYHFRLLWLNGSTMVSSEQGVTKSLNHKCFILNFRVRDVRNMCQLDAPNCNTKIKAAKTFTNWQVANFVSTKTYSFKQIIVNVFFQKRPQYYDNKTWPLMLI